MATDYANAQEEEETIKLVWESLLDAELHARRYNRRAVRWRNWRRWSDFIEALGATSAVVSILSAASAWLSGALILVVAISSALKQGFRVPEHAEDLEVATRAWSDRKLQWEKVWASVRLGAHVNEATILAQLDANVEAHRSAPLLPFKKSEVLTLQDEIEFSYVGNVETNA